MKYTLTFVLVLWPIFVFAQATPPTVPPPPPPFREGTAEFSFVGTTGNSETQTIGLGGEVIVRPAPWVIRNKALFIRNESEDQLTAKSFLYLFRADRALTTRLSAFGEYNYFRDRFAGVEHQNNLLAGLAYKIVDLPAHLLVVDGGLGYLNEKRLTGEDVSSATYGSGLSYKWKISESAEFADDFRFTGTFADGEDWRIYQIAALTTRISTLFSLKVSNTVRYANLPPPGFRDTDTITAVALVAKF